MQEHALTTQVKKLGYVIAAAGLSVATLAATAFAAPVTVNDCTFEESPGMWSLVDNCTVTAQIDVPSGTVLDGNGFTITAGFDKTSNSNNAVLGVINATDVTVQNVTLENGGMVDLHGLNVYQSTGVMVADVSINNFDHTGLLVNGSYVHATNLSTSGNGWHGVNVDQGSGVTMPSVFTVDGVSHQTDAAHIYVDDTTKMVAVVDVNNQYVMTMPVTVPDAPNDALYTLKPMVASKDECKNGGWMNILGSQGQSFKNQGQCVAAVVSSDHSKHNR